MESNSLQHELWLNRLSAASYLPVSHSELLISCLCEQLKVRLERGESIRQQGLGYWESETKGEFVALLPDGKRILLPPRVHLRLCSKPSKRLCPDEQLVRALSETSGLLLDVCQRWWNILGELLLRDLELERVVVWPEIGLFRAQEGEICFEPQGEVCEYLDRAFSVFIPVELHEKAELDDTPSLPFESIEEALQRCSLLRREDEKEEYSIDESSREIPFDNSPEQQPEERKIALPHTEVQMEEEEIFTHPEEPERETPPTDSIEHPRKGSNLVKSQWVWIALVLLLILLLLSALFLFTSQGEKKKGENLPNQSIIPQEKSRKTTSTDTVAMLAANQNLKPDSDTMKSASLANGETKESTISTSSTTSNIIETSQSTERHTENAHWVRIQPGERLNQIALREYGDKAFWVYIYRANKNRISNPDRVPSGLNIRLPRIGEYGLTRTDSVGVWQARRAEQEWNLKKTKQE
ncbi:LysM peptidoglycan-binding domain-containing protein [Porphyromonas crevioricanis]|uniref:LysM domain-containing protein n=1 Tax=Porphyromonas crevioricanis JCM 15906 TaxID=1305617 RepID=T1CPD1_9PORP|nr:hypothetical protein [Porphyromonas crevioricanis]GAD04978.1 hypothetical protein PORCRE_675 [Porphyromonas crevioricanis JCM 15906]SJZ80796.1 Nucleoid-associated protein YgaU, contains BON and LysM domains [Porphyromonas crevioricanis]